MGDEYSLLAEVFLGEGGEGKSEQEILSDIDASLSGLPNYKRVTKVVIREEPFPKTSTNKIKRSY
jgi:hypothetical protein